VAAAAEAATAATPSAFAWSGAGAPDASRPADAADNAQIKALPYLLRTRREDDRAAITSGATCSTDAASTTVTALSSVTTTAVAAEEAGPRISACFSMASRTTWPARSSGSTSLPASVEGDQAGTDDLTDIEFDDAAMLAACAGWALPSRTTISARGARVASSRLTKTLPRGTAPSLPGCSGGGTGKPADYNISLYANLVCYEDQVAAVEEVFLVLKLVENDDVRPFRINHNCGAACLEEVARRHIRREGW
jgi:hypothetical protein